MRVRLSKLLIVMLLITVTASLLINAPSARAQAGVTVTGFRTSVSPSATIVGNGTDTATITIEAIDSGVGGPGNVVPGAQFSISIAGATGTLTSGLALTSSGTGTGSITFTVREANVTANHQLTVTATLTSNPAITTNVLLQVTAPTANAVTLVAGKNTLIADNTDSTTLTVNVKDQSNNNLANAPVTISPNPVGTGMTYTNGLTGTTDASGNFVTTVRTNKVQPNISYTATSGSVSSTPAVVLSFVPQTFTLNIGTASLAANDTATSTVTLTLTDASGGITAPAIQLAMSGFDSTTQTVTQVTGTVTVSSNSLITVVPTAAGTASFTIRSRSATVVGITPTYLAPNGATIVSSPANGTVTFTTAVKSLTIATNLTSAVVNNPATITVTALDFNDAPIQNQAITITTAGTGITYAAVNGALTGSGPSGTTDATGIFRFTATSATSQGPVTFAASSGGVNSTPANVSVTWSGAIAANVVLASASNNVLINTNNLMTVTVTTSGGIPVPNATVVIATTATNLGALSFAPVIPASFSNLTPITGLTNASGIFSFNIQSSVPQATSFTATVGALVSTPATAVTFANPLATSITLAPSPTASVAINTNQQISVTVVDGSNPISGAPVTIIATGVNTAALTYSGTFTPIVNGITGVTNASGVFTFNVQSSVVQSISFTGSTNGTSGVLTSLATTVSFTAGTTGSTQLVVSPTTVANPALGTVTITARDNVGAVLPSTAVSVVVTNGGANLTYAVVSGTLGATSNTSVAGTTNASGVFSFTVGASTAATTTFQATAASVTSTLGTITFTVTRSATSTPSTQNVVANDTTEGTITILVTDFPSTPVSGAVVTVTGGGVGITYRAEAGTLTGSGPSGTTDATGRLILRMRSGTIQNVTYNFTVTGVTTSISSATVNFTAAPPATATFTPTPTPTPITSGTVTLTTSTTSIAVNTDATITVVVRDSGNAAISGATVNITPTGTNLSALTYSISTGTFTTAPSGTTDSNGTFTFRVRSSATQTVSFAATVGSLVSSPTAVSVTFTSAAIDPVQSKVFCLLNGQVVSAVPADGKTVVTVSISLRDASGNPVANTVYTFGPPNPSIAGLTITGTQATDGSGNSILSMIASQTSTGPVSFPVSAGTPPVSLAAPCSITFSAANSTPIFGPTPIGGLGTLTAVGTQATATPTRRPFLRVVSTGPQVGRVIAFRLRVRSGPGLNFPILGVIQYGTSVKILARNVSGNWYKIELEGGASAWVSALWVRLSRVAFRRLPIEGVDGNVVTSGGATVLQSSQPVNPGVGQATGQINTFLLRGRREPSLDSAQVGSFLLGTDVLITGISSDGRWYRIATTTAGEVWVSAVYVKIININGGSINVVG